MVTRHENLLWVGFVDSKNGKRPRWVGRGISRAGREGCVEGDRARSLIAEAVSTRWIGEWGC